MSSVSESSFIQISRQSSNWRFLLHADQLPVLDPLQPQGEFGQLHEKQHQGSCGCLYRATTLYVFDSEDPILASYHRIFPSLFKNISAMPEDLRRHVRYPEVLFKVQSEVYGHYHMTTPSDCCDGVRNRQ
jgi:hypothetical protein